jgi:hypothetical protein
VTSARGRIAGPALLGLLAAGAACATARVAEHPLPPDLAWPAGEPHVRLERLLDTQRGGGPLFGRPYGVAWQGEDLLVSDAAARRVVRITREGLVQRSPSDAAGAATEVAACPLGIVVTDSQGGRVALLGPDLKRVRWLAEGLQRPTGVACLGGEVFVAETGAHRILAFGSGPEPRVLGGRGEGSGEFNFPTFLAADDTSLWVGDTLNFRVQRLDPRTGGTLAVFGRLGDSPGEMPRAKGIAVDAAGHLWMADAHLDQVSLYTLDGSLLMILGRKGSEPGDFSFPAGIAAHADGRVAVADSFNGRVQVFRVLDAPAAHP